MEITDMTSQHTIHNKSNQNKMHFVYCKNHINRIFSENHSNEIPNQPMLQSESIKLQYKTLTKVN